MSDYTLYHYSRCSKSRTALDLLESKGIQADIVHYLETPPSEAELEQLLNKLGCSARDIIRTGESEYQELGLDNPELTEQQLIAAMHQNPILIQRPILATNDKAVVGRPEEKLLELLP